MHSSSTSLFFYRGFVNPMSMNCYFEVTHKVSLQMPNNFTQGSELQSSVRQLIQAAQNYEKWEQRRYERFPISRSVTINLDHGMPQFSALTREVSRTGLGLLHKNPLRTDKEISMTIQYQYGYAVTVPVLCVWCRPCGAHWYISGVCFRNVTTGGDSAAVEFTESTAARHQLDSSHAWDSERMLSPNTILHLLELNFEELTKWHAYDKNIDRRSENRYHVSLPVTATPVDDDLQSVGDSFDAITRDISSRGLSLFSHRKLDNMLLTLQLLDNDGQTKLDAVMEILRCQPIGDSYMISGRFASKRYFD